MGLIKREVFVEGFSRIRMHDRFQILDVFVSVVNPQKACAMVDDMIRQKRPGYVCVAPVSTIISCQEDRSYREVVNNAAMVTPDGMPLVWLARMAGYKLVQRTYGPDLMLAVCDLGQAKGYRHFLYGGSAAALEKMVGVLKAKFSAIDVVGSYSPPFRPLTQEENDQVVHRINEAQPDIVWVGLGSPKQDFWMKANRERIEAPVMVGVGAAFDFISGIKKQAPRWMQKAGLEWLFRLGTEPRRLWKRYLIGNAKFIYLLTKRAIVRKR